MTNTCFYAFPANSGHVNDAIERAAELSESKPLILRPWPKMRTFGLKLDDLIRSEIDEAAFFAADLTFPNLNVFYELGFAIARGKPILTTLHTGIERAQQRVAEMGLFDVIGWLGYMNGEDLARQLPDWDGLVWTNSYQKPRDFTQPLFVLDTHTKTDFRNSIFNSVNNSGLEYRSFDPAEIPRLTAAQAIGEISASAGVILPLIGDDVFDHEKHNLRVGFLLGLAHGFNIETLLIQYGNGPAPLDYRDFVTNSTYRHETATHVSEYAQKVLIWNQRDSGRTGPRRRGILSRLNLGSPAAENETRSLGKYFVTTAEYARALRTEGAIVVGRKGSGKSAIFFQVHDRLAEDRRTCVVDLRPASHNLSEMREQILSIVSKGVFDHTVASFWQYVILMEVILKLREFLLPLARNDFDLQQRIIEFESEFGLTDSVVAGDFTSRLKTAVTNVINEISNCDGASTVRERITNLMFERPIPKLRDYIVSFTDRVSDIVVLIDDLDKGWPARQAEAQDVIMVKHLVESLNKIQRDLGKRNVDLKHLLFLRSDIYEKLVEETSDRGKYNVISVDWSGEEQLRHLLRERVVAGLGEADATNAWAAANPTLSNGNDAVHVMVAHSLRRPRFLIDVAERVLSSTINRGVDHVEEEDVNEGLRQMSLYLVSDFGYEMRDIAGTPADIFYHFIGSAERLTQVEVEERLEGVDLNMAAADVIESMLWYGFLGIVDENGESVYIYDREYDFRRLEAELKRVSGERIYAINQAFLLGLN